MDRRDFFRTGMGMTLAGSVAGMSTDVFADSDKKMSAVSGQESFKFSVFADIHHNPGVFYTRTPEHLVQIQERALKERCDLIIHAGDFCHDPTKIMDFVELYNNFSIPSYHCLGNHDQDGCAWEQTLECYKMPNGHYFFDKKGFRFIVFDPNYLFLDGKYVHYTKGNYYKHPKALNNVPPEQVEWMKQTMTHSPFPCILISHQSLERESGGVKNRHEIRKIINDINKRFPGRVRLCINGHYHRDFISIQDNVIYFDLNSASYDWVGNRACKGLFPEELCKQYRAIDHTVVYNDPVHAVITMKQDGYIKIDGMESSMFMGIDRAKAKASLYDSAGRPVFPRVSSAEMKMFYGPAKN